MLYTIFSAILNMSITASIVIIVVLLARLLLKRAPKVFSYALWGVVLFRLLCPISLTSDFSLMNFLRTPTADSGRIEYVTLNTDSTESPKITITVPATDINQGATQSLGDEIPRTDTFDIPVSVLSTVWLCGVAAMLTFNIVQLIRLRGKLIGAIPLCENIYLADHIPTPFVMGVLRPKIYLPSMISDTEQSYIIQHEKHHIRRGDHMIKLLAFAAMCIHWFNPLVWLAFVLSGKDMEMSCDEAVMKRIDGDIRADYSSSLLQFSTGKRVILGTPLAFGEGDTKERIENIMKYRKPTFIIVALALALCIGLTACLSSNPQSDTEKHNLSEIAIENTDPSVSTEVGVDLAYKYTYEELSEMPAEELLELFIQNGLVINDELKALFTEKELEALFKENFDMWHTGMSVYSYTVYLDLAEQTKAIYDKIANSSAPNNDAYPIGAGFADEDMLSSGNYHEFIADGSEYTVKLIFVANEALTDVRFTSLEYGDDGTYSVADELYTLPLLTADKPLVTGVVFYGSMTAYGISFTDADGRTHYCFVSISGQDGALLMNEYHSCFLHSCLSH